MRTFHTAVPDGTDCMFENKDVNGAAAEDLPIVTVPSRTKGYSRGGAFVTDYFSVGTTCSSHTISGLLAEDESGFMKTRPRQRQRSELT